jgi:hypothetical protein
LNDDYSITDSKLIAESFNEYFFNIGPSLVSEASEEPLTQHTTNSYHNSNPTTDTVFHFHHINVENIVLANIGAFCLRNISHRSVRLQMADLLGGCEFCHGFYEKYGLNFCSISQNSC